MKHKDLIIVVLVIFITAIFSYFIANALVPTPEKRKLEAEVVDKISTTFERPDARYFNAQSLNPTKQITIGEQPNQKPFNTTPGR